MYKLLTCAVALIATAATAAVPSSQRDALIAIYDKTGGPNWVERTNWRGEPGTECDWFGVECDGTQTKVIGLQFYANGLVGPIPAEVRNLPDLQTLIMAGNALSGPIPAEVFQLTNLETIVLNDAGLTGTISPQFGSLTKLKTLALVGNTFSGSIPKELGNLTALDTLMLSYNQLTGSIPPELGNLPELLELSAAVNRLSGPIPKELGRLSKLERLFMTDNALTGSIPPELGDLSALVELRLDYNDLEGTIPTRLASLRNLERLDLGRNRLSGNIPAELGQLSSLKFLNLFTNRLEGTIPSSIYRMANLEELHVGENKLTGSLPPDIALLRNLRVLALYGNQFTGALPVEIGQMTTLRSLELQGNGFEGRIPEQLGNLKELTWIDLAANDFTGLIPRELGSLPNLEMLSLYENGLVGPIPPELGQLTKLVLLYLTSNRLTGTIPDALRNLKQLRNLYLGGNLLEGGIPSWIGELTELRDLFLAYGQLTGPIPPSIGDLANLEAIYLNDNRFSGALPRELTRLQKLYYISLSFNEFSGTIPPEIWELPLLTGFWAGDNKFSGTLPPSIGNAKNLDTLELRYNDLSGPLPAELGDLPNLKYLTLAGNSFSGTIPRELGKLTQLLQLALGENALRGAIPPELRALTALELGNSDFGYNALVAPDEATRAFVNQRHYDGDFEATQTVPPSDVRLVSTTDRSAVVEWTPIRFSWADGGYQVVARTSAGGPAVAIATTATKDFNSITVRGLQPQTSYIFNVTTVTHPHGFQKNLIVSDPAAALQGTTKERVLAPPDVVLTEAPAGLVQLDGVPQNEDSFTLTNFGDMESAITLPSDGGFFTLEPESFTLGGGKSQTVRVRSTPKPPDTYYGYVDPEGEGVDPDLFIYLSLLSATRPSGTVVAQAERTRVEVAGEPGSDSVGQVRFRNTGTATLTGIVQSDQSWVVPPNEKITIEAGQIGIVNFRVVRSRKREGVGALTANLSLVYVEGTAQSAGARIEALQQNPPPGSGVGVSRVTIVDTTKPPVTSSNIPGLGGDVALFAPGIASFLRNGKNYVSDIAITNASDARVVNDLRVFYTPASTSQSSVATLTSLDAAQSVSLVNVVSNVYGGSGVGTLQIRSVDWENLGAFAKLVNAEQNQTTTGDVPVFRSDRSAGQGEATYLAGVGLQRSLTRHVDLYLQETGGSPLQARIDFLDANGAAVGTPRTVSLGAFELQELANIVAEPVTTMVVTNVAGSAGRLAAYARLTDDVSGDSWSVVDWSRYQRFTRNEPVRVPFVDGFPRSTTPSRRRRVVPHATFTRAETEVTLFNPTTVDVSASLRVVDASGQSSTREVVVHPRQTMTIENAGGSVTGAAHAMVSIDRDEQLVVSARSVRGGVGAAVPIVPASAGLRVGQLQRFSNLDDSTMATVDAGTPGTFRTSFVLVESSGAPATVRASMSLDAGSSLVNVRIDREFALGPNQVIVGEHLVRAIIGDTRETDFGELHNLQLQLEVVGGTGSVMPLVIVTENATGDSVVRLE